MFIFFLHEKYIAPFIEKTNKKNTDESRTPSVTDIHIAPNYKSEKQSQTKTFFGSIIEVFSIEFEDGLKEEVFIYKKNNLAYFKALKKGMWVVSKHKYENIELCINALHFYLKTGEIHQIGFIESF